MKDLIETILNDVCLDERIETGVFDVNDSRHIVVLWEYLINKGIPKKLVNEECNRLVEKGQHPDRQAYNKDGLLITFPTPKHKADAISKGTHFENDPTKPAPNIFDDPQSPGPGQPSPGAPVGNEPPTTAPPSPEKPPQPAPTPEPPVKPDTVSTPAEKSATSALIKQMMKSDDSILEKVASWLAENNPEELKETFQK